MVPQGEAEALHRSLLNSLNIQVAGASGDKKRARPASATTRPPLHQPIVRPTPVKLVQAAQQHARARPQSATTRAPHDPVLTSKPLDIMLSIIQASKHRSRHELTGQLQQESTISAIEHLPLQPFVTIAGSEGGWKRFFETFNDGHTAAHDRARQQRAHSSKLPLPAATVPQQSYNSVSARRARLAQQIRRLRTLFAELKVPAADRNYIVATYCGDCTLSGEALAAAEQEVQKQIALLLAHRTATIAVLRAITEREAALAAVQAAHDRWQQCCSRGSTAAAAATVAAAAVEAVVAALVELRRASAAVVAQISEWRALLWQPQAFMWKGVNYLLKMSSDVEPVLHYDTRAQLLAAAGLSSGDMLLLLPALSSSSSSTHNNLKQSQSVQHCTGRAAARLRATFWERCVDGTDCSEQQGSAQLMQVGDHAVIQSYCYMRTSCALCIEYRSLVSGIHKQSASA
jgi:hypothetical protein